ncbi:unnamed protein product, partial [Lampetra fluviatilis]
PGSGERVPVSAGHVLFHVVVYLAPGDYHRFHSPARWTLQHRRHFPGRLVPVSPRVSRYLPGLYCLNERVVLSGRWSHGFIALDRRGGHQRGLHTGFTGTRRSMRLMDNDEVVDEVDNEVDNEVEAWPGGAWGRCGGLRVDKGHPLGEFNLGSTVVLLFEAPATFRFSVRPGQKIRYGEALGNVLERLHV